MKKPYIFTLSHLAVDFACFNILFALLLPALPDGNGGTLFLLYNLLAFGLQAPIGAFIDSRPRLRAIGPCLGGVVTALGLAAAYLGRAFVPGPVFPVLGMTVAALGNAVFHVCVGSIVLTESGGALSPAGLFNCAGALGVGFGTYFGTGIPAVSVPAALVVIVLASLALWTLRRDELREVKPATDAEPLPGWALALLCAAMVLHGLGGSWMPEPPLNGALTLLPPIMICLGRLSGGVLGDAAGRRSAVLMMAVSAPLVILSGATPWPALVGTLLFWTIVPLFQLTALSALPDSPGFAFGLTKLCLLAGTFLSSLAAPSEYDRRWIVGAAALVAAALTLLATGKNKKKETIK